MAVMHNADEGRVMAALLDSLAQVSAMTGKEFSVVTWPPSTPVPMPDCGSPVSVAEGVELVPCEDQPTRDWIRENMAIEIHYLFNTYDVVPSYRPRPRAGETALNLITMVPLNAVDPDPWWEAVEFPDSSSFSVGGVLIIDDSGLTAHVFVQMLQSAPPQPRGNWITACHFWFLAGRPLSEALEIFERTNDCRSIFDS